MGQDFDKGSLSRFSNEVLIGFTVRTIEPRFSGISDQKMMDPKVIAVGVQGSGSFWPHLFLVGANGNLQQLPIVVRVSSVLDWVTGFVASCLGSVLDIPRC